MCQKVTGPKVKLEEQWAWKQFGKLTEKTWSGPLYGRNLPRGHWLSTKLKLFVPGLGKHLQTKGGFHVLTEKYGTWRGAPRLRRRIRIRGYAYPFDGGYAVTSIFVPLPRRSKRA